MFKKIWITLFLLIPVAFASVFAQNLTTLDEQLDYVNRNNMTSQNDEQDLVFFFYRYQSETLDLTHFKKYNPSLVNTIPDSLEIVPPKPQGISDMVYAVAYLHTAYNEGKLLVMMVGNYATGYPSYFVDYNLDQDYTNDGPPFIFIPTKNGRYKKYHKFDLEKDGKGYSFKLLNPNAHQRQSLDNYNEYASGAKTTNDNQVSQNVRKLSIRELHNKGLFAGVGVFTGGGKVEYNHTNGDTEFTTFYDVDYNPLGIDLSVSYVFRNFQLGINLAHENINYYSSQKKIEIKDNSQLIVNRDILPGGRTVYGVSLSYNANVSKYIALAPRYRYQKYSFSSSNQYVPDKRHLDVTLPLEDRYMNSLGLLVKFIVAEKSLIYVVAEKQFDQFNPIGFAENADAQNLTTTKQQTIFGVGYQFRLF